MLFVVQNDPEVPLGAFVEYLADSGTQCSIIHPYRGDRIPFGKEASGIIVLGGAMGVHDVDRHPFLIELKDFIRECVADSRPYLGICLGGQLLADALGGVVNPGTCGEKGTHSARLTPEGVADPLFAGLPQEFITFQWHNDSFIPPRQAVHLASSPACPTQAFRLGTNAYGLQFHPEVNRTIVDCWARWSEETARLADDFVSSFAEREVNFRLTSRRILENFLSIAHPGRQ